MTSSLPVSAEFYPARWSPRKQFLRFRRSLRGRRVARIQFVYGVLAASSYITLTAAASEESAGPLHFPAYMRTRLLHSFERWMSEHQPDWLDGPDCGGVLTWELSGNVFTHRHCGYTQHFFARNLRSGGNRNDQQKSARFDEETLTTRETRP